MILESFKHAFDLVLTLDKDFFEILLLSMKVSCLSLLLSCLVGLPMGTYLAIKNFWCRDTTVSYTHLTLPTTVIV